ncbi:MAG: hypothetical protein RBT74_14830 [Tenuifilaceae bacterium]|jgi:hypothetical protein|nr:hypothetical protein [Tenuifilaceae bacterium]
MSIRKYCSIVIITLLLGSIYSCQKENADLTEVEIVTNPVDTIGKVVFGKKLENPYSVKNMRIALESLKVKKMVKAEDVELIEIMTTHLYVEIPTADNSNLDMFVQDTSLELFNHPLDYDLPEEGSFYQDTSFTNYDPTWLYTVVPVDCDLTLINHRVLEECFLPNYELKETVEKNIVKAELLQLLEYEAYLITGNLKDTNSYNTKSRQYPRGTITVQNTLGYPDGLKGVKIRVHNFMRVDSDITNEYGNYSISTGFLTGVHYAVIFKNSKDFKIWGNWAFIAPAHYYMGWHTSSGLDRLIKKSSGAWKWGSINNAIYAYYELCNVFSIYKPPSDLRVWVFEKGDGTTKGSASMLRRTYGFYGFNTGSIVNNLLNTINGVNISLSATLNLLKFVQPDITISVNSSNVESEDVYNTTFHECAHASHWTKVGSYFWVQYINYIITYGNSNNPYSNGLGYNAGYCGVGEMWGNYIGALFQRYHFSYTTPYSLDWWWFDEDEDWYNPGFLKNVDNISDISTSEIFSCLSSNTNTILKLVEQLKTKTAYVEQINFAYGLYTDWP